MIMVKSGACAQVEDGLLYMQIILYVGLIREHLGLLKKNVSIMMSRLFLMLPSNLIFYVAIVFTFSKVIWS